MAIGQIRQPTHRSHDVANTNLADIPVDSPGARPKGGPLIGQDSLPPPEWRPWADAFFYFCTGLLNTPHASRWSGFFSFSSSVSQLFSFPASFPEAVTPSSFYSPRSFVLPSLHLLHRKEITRNSHSFDLINMRGTTVVAATAALFASSAVAGHKAVVHNLCDSDVYLWSVDASDSVDGAVARNPATPYTIRSGSSYREVMRQLQTGGVSMKLSQSNDLYGAISQFEYTWDGKTWYDISNVNCEGEDCPFAVGGMYLESGPGCPTATCPPGNATCHQAYNDPHDDWASLCCPEGEPDVTLFLCADSPEAISAPAPEHSTSSYATPEVEAAQVTTPPTHHRRPKPTPVDPETEIVEVTQVSTVVVTVTPGADHHRRHVHQHAHAHAH
jgi:hypothetical protein